MIERPIKRKKLNMQETQEYHAFVELEQLI